MSRFTPFAGSLCAPYDASVLARPHALTAILEGSAIAVGRRGGSPIYYKFVDLLVQQVVLQRDGEDPDLKAFAVTSSLPPTRCSSLVFVALTR